MLEQSDYNTFARYLREVYGHKPKRIGEVWQKNKATLQRNNAAIAHDKAQRKRDPRRAAARWLRTSVATPFRPIDFERAPCSCIKDDDTRSAGFFTTASAGTRSSCSTAGTQTHIEYTSGGQTLAACAIKMGVGRPRRHLYYPRHSLIL
jgi:hypothetical protein